MKRREFIIFLGGAAVAWPLAARAQQVGIRRVGVLLGVGETDPEGQARVTAFQQGLQELGWVEGRNIRVDYRFAAGDPKRIRAYTAELVAMAPDAILGNTTPVMAELQSATHSVPIVFVQVVDPIGRGFVTNLAQPGGNITGFINFEFSMGSKWLETLTQVASKVARVAVVYNPQTAPFGDKFVRQVEIAAPSFRVETTTMLIGNSNEFDRLISAFAAKPRGGLIVLPDLFNTSHRDLIVSLAARYQLPAVYPFRYFAESGGLISDGVDTKEQFRRAAGYVDRILRGSKPGDLPVQAPSKFEMVINLKTAKTLGLDVPTQLLARADEVIE